MKPGQDHLPFRSIDELAQKFAGQHYIRPHATEFNPRRMLRQNTLHGQDGLDLALRRRVIKKTGLLLLCDVSGSMERYSRFLIQFIYALRQQLTGMDLAIFSTPMTVITEYLKQQISMSPYKRYQKVCRIGRGPESERACAVLTRALRRLCATHTA